MLSFDRTASWLLLALTLLALRSTGVKAQDSTAVAPVSIERTGWFVTVDSAEDTNQAWMATDDDPTTFWHTPWNPDAPLNHWIQIDMGTQYAVTGFSYLPRQDGNTNGNIGTHIIDVSVDGVNWNTVSQGNWANDQTLKTTLWTTVIARFVRLTATSEASNTGKQYTSLAEMNVLTNPHSALPRNWQVSASSEEVGQQSWAAYYAIDGSPTTFWHSDWSSGTQQMPQWFTIDQGVATTVGGLSYLPRPASTGGNGRIGGFTVMSSDDGNNWNNVVSGVWPDTEFQKVVEWQPITARFWRLQANSEAGNRGPWASASEINLLDGGVNLANFKVTVDSQETAAMDNSAARAQDGDITTFWHTQWSGDNVPGYPHTYTIDMQVSLPVKALQYVPRQDGSQNGNIGQHTIAVSNDGDNWQTVATGAFADTQQAKNVIFQETVCRFVRLIATSEAGNRGPWASAAELSISYDASYVAPDPSTMGQWGLTVDFPLVPVAVAMKPNGDVMAWSSYAPDGFTINPGGRTITAEYNPASGQVSKSLITNTDHDMFCPGISLDFNGRIVVTGGNDAPRLSVYDPNQGWLYGPNMNVARGYQASTTLSTGNVFTIGGSWSGGIFQKNGEQYIVDQNTWQMLNGADVTPMLTNDFQGTYRADNHAWLFGWKDGTVFQAGPSKAMNWYWTTDGGGVVGAGQRADATDQMCGTATMYDAPAGKILGLGGSIDYSGSPANNNAYVITIGNAGDQPDVQRVNNMNFARIFHNSIVLPNGQVFVNGGQNFGSPFNDDSSIMYPETWDPNTGVWSLMAPISVPRNYHSTAVLLPDATILVGGGGLCDGCSYNHYDGQVYSPPYLFTDAQGTRAQRPQITFAPGQIQVGATITVNTDSPVIAFALIRMGSATHTVNTDQRRIPLDPNCNGNSCQMTLPGDAGIALPGYWMLFALNEAGVPSVAATVQVTL